jgi:hypothetical protein
MAQNFRNVLTKNVTSSATTLFTPNSYDTVKSVRLCNTHSGQILMDIFVTNGGVDYYLALNVPIPAGGQYEVMEQGSMLVLGNGDVLKATSDTSSSADAIVCYVDAIST